MKFLTTTMNDMPIYMFFIICFVMWGSGVWFGYNRGFSHLWPF